MKLWPPSLQENDYRSSRVLRLPRIAPPAPKPAAVLRERERNHNIWALQALFMGIYRIMGLLFLERRTVLLSMNLWPLTHVLDSTKDVCSVALESVVRGPRISV